MAENNRDIPENLSPEEAQLAKTVVSCFLESTVISTTAAFITYKGTRNYINKSKSSSLKSWGTFVNISTAFIAFSAARSMYGKVCIKRVENLPPSLYKDRILQQFKDPVGIKSSEGMNDTWKTIQKRLEEKRNLQSGNLDVKNSGDATSFSVHQKMDTNTQDNHDHQVHNEPSFDTHKAHSTKSQNEFDYSRTNKPAAENDQQQNFDYSTHSSHAKSQSDNLKSNNPVIPVNETNQDISSTLSGQGSKVQNELDFSKPKVMRRNKYGDIIEDA